MSEGVDEFKTYKRRGEKPGLWPKIVGLGSDKAQVYKRRGKGVKDSMEKVVMLGIMDFDTLVEGGRGHAYMEKEATVEE